jgi:hypothetical protein
MLEAFVLDGTVTLLALGVLALELVAIIGVSLARGLRPAGDLVANALSGAFLILALRAALMGSGATTLAACLGLAFVAHITALAIRLRG